MIPRSAVAAATLLLVVGCSSSPSLRECAVDGDCGGGGVCHVGTCTANGRPTADFAVPPATTHRVVSFVPSARDPEGQALTLEWSVRTVAASCEAEPEPAIGSTLDVVFWCPGTYEVALVAVDPLGLPSIPVVRSIQVAAATGVPVVQAGAAIAATHSCDPAGPSCTVAGPDRTPSLHLAATGSDPGQGALQFEWVAVPPLGVASDPTLQVAFVPGPHVDSPTASIANGGGAIAGAYRFRVRVRNPSGLLAQAFQDVVVGNAPPTVALPPPSVPHRYAGGQFLAEADLDPRAADPEADPVAVEAALAPAAPAGCQEEISPIAGGKLHLRIACSLPTDLIGSTPRTLRVTARDANGGTATVEAPLSIENQPPRIRVDPRFANSILALDHRVEPCLLAPGTRCFVADGVDPFAIDDPDGDPLGSLQFSAGVAPGRPSSRGTASIDGATFRHRFETPVGAPGEFRAASGASGFTLSASATDPLGATTTVTQPIVIRNRPPVLREAVPTASAPHLYDAAARRYAATVPGPLFEDPDGDPLAPTVGGLDGTSGRIEAGRVHVTFERPWDYTLGGVPPLSEFLLGTLAVIDVSDGWDGVGTTTFLSIVDRPATLAAPAATSERCSCVSGVPCSRWEASGTGLTIPVQLVDPDGDPAQVSLATANNVAQPPPVTCLPGWCYPKANGSGTQAITGNASAQSGATVPLVDTPFNVTAVCSTAGQCCP